MDPLHQGNPGADAWRILCIVAACSAVAVRPDVMLGEVPAMDWIGGLCLALVVYLALGGGVGDEPTEPTEEE